MASYASVSPIMFSLREMPNGAVTAADVRLLRQCTSSQSASILHARSPAPETYSPTPTCLAPCSWLLGRMCLDVRRGVRSSYAARPRLARRGANKA